MIGEKGHSVQESHFCSRSLALTHPSTGLFIPFPSPSRSYCFLILLNCIGYFGPQIGCFGSQVGCFGPQIGCFWSQIIYFLFIDFDKYDTFPSSLHLTITKPHSTDSLHSSRHKHQEWTDRVRSGRQTQ